nr:protein S100-A4-like [Anolis sagrei ordinatus]
MMHPPLEEALGVMVNTFHKYSSREGDPLKLNTDEMKELLVHELPTFVRGKIHEVGLETVMRKLDSNKDGELDFPEYAVFLALVANLCHEFFAECADEKNRKR